jgi:lactoylglutathione lyase
MRLAKPQFDLGLFSSQREAQLAFWQSEVGLPYDHMGRLGGGMQQHRHHMNGAILKMNHARDPLPALPQSGYRQLFVARPGLDAPKQLHDPDGNPVTLVPQGHDGIASIAVALKVNNRDAAEHFYRHGLQLPSPRKHVYAVGEALLLVGEEGKVERVDEWRAPGYRYITMQIFDAVAEHAGILARGGAEGQPVRLLGDTVRYSFVRDPDGNFIEISQRASLTGGKL